MSPDPVSQNSDAAAACASFELYVFNSIMCKQKVRLKMLWMGYCSRFCSFLVSLQHGKIFDNIVHVSPHCVKFTEIDSCVSDLQKEALLTLALISRGVLFQLMSPKWMMPSKFKPTCFQAANITGYPEDT